MHIACGMWWMCWCIYANTKVRQRLTVWDYMMIQMHNKSGFFIYFSSELSFIWSKLLNQEKFQTFFFGYFFIEKNLNLKSSNWLWNMGSFWVVTIFVRCIIYSISLSIIADIWIWATDHLCWFIIFNHQLCMFFTFLPIGCFVTVIKWDKRN